MNTFVSGESDAKGFVGNSSLYCVWSGSRGNPPPRNFYNQHNPMEQTHSNALMNHAGALYAAYLNAAKEHHPEMSITSWPEFVCDPLNKVSVGCWIAVAKVAVKMENDARDNSL